MRLDTPEMSVSQLRTMIQIARIFVEGKALTPDAGVLLAIDATLRDTKKHDALASDDGSEPK